MLKHRNFVYPIQGKEVAIFNMFSVNVRYDIKLNVLNVLVITNEEKLLAKGTFMAGS